jgi:deoxyribodipyrimidine photo-lyase
MRTIVWFRDSDLRVADHLPLTKAIEGGEVIPVFVLDPHLFSCEAAADSPHQMQFRLESLGELAKKLRTLGSQLVLEQGSPSVALPGLVQRWKADRVVTQKNTDPLARSREASLELKLRNKLEYHGQTTLLAPGSIRTRSGQPYSVFTPFLREFLAVASIDRPLPAPTSIPAPPRDLRSHRVEVPDCNSLGIKRNLGLGEGGESAASRRLQTFVDSAVSSYAKDRDRMDLPGTSRLAADLRHGTISVRQVWHAVHNELGHTDSARRFLSQLVWREFNASTLWDRPDLLEQPFRHDFAEFPWKDDDAGWEAWVKGATGYPIVDASARQLMAEGFVHNRARMISASFLCKHLLIHYSRGESHYMRYLTEADHAQNLAGWQWSAGCGCDAQPYFRVFNPTLQGKKFDPHGDYVRRWVPELSTLPAKHIHSPWDAPESVLEQAGVRLGANYPRPIVDHRFARSRFLDLARRHLSAGRARTPVGARIGERL